MVKIEEWLETNLENLYQESTKNRELILPSENLEGELKLDSGFENIKSLVIHKNKITDSNLKFFSQLEEFRCANNRLTNINFLSDLPCPEKLQILDIKNNNIQSTNLDFLKSFVNLCEIHLGSEDDWTENIQVGIFNRFCGSLEPLKYLEKLTFVDIENTDIDSGLEHLLESKLIKKESLYANCKLRPDARVGNIWKAVRPNAYHEWSEQLKTLKKEEEFRKTLFIVFISLIMVVFFLVLYYFFRKNRNQKKNWKNNDY